MGSRQSSILAAAVASVLLWSPVARAEGAVPLDTAKFGAACTGAQTFLLGEVPPGVDAAAVIGKVCSCLVTAFSGFTQAEIDILATDLDGTATEASHAAFGDYAALEERAGDGLSGCFASPEVTALMTPPAPPAN